MKSLFALFFMLLFTISVNASCSGNGLWVFPSDSMVKQNSIFVLDGYAASQKIILGLNKKYPIYLQSGEKKIKLLVTEICVGQYRLTQAVLKPETELEAGLTYTMQIDSLSKYEGLYRYNYKKHISEDIKYTVIAGKDIDKPVLSSNPKVIGNILEYYGCGPEMYVVFNNPAKDNSSLIVKTTVKNLKTGKETTYYIQPDKKNKIYVGRSMCDGAFTFDEGRHYEVEFAFVDACGNVTPWVGKRIRFTSPSDIKNKDGE